MSSSCVQQPGRTCIKRYTAQLYTVLFISTVQCVTQLVQAVLIHQVTKALRRYSARSHRRSCITSFSFCTASQTSTWRTYSGAKPNRNMSGARKSPTTPNRISACHIIGNSHNLTPQQPTHGDTSCGRCLADQYTWEVLKFTMMRVPITAAINA